MTVNVPLVANTDTFLKQLNTLNTLANLMSNSVLTLGSTANGSFAVTGNVSANVLNTNFIFSIDNVTQASFANTLAVTNTISVGNSSSNLFINATSLSISNANNVLTIQTPNISQSSNGQFFLNANGSFTTVPTVSLPITTGVTNTTNLSTQLIDSWSTTNYNLANYNIFVIDNVANNFYSSKLSMAYNSNNILITEYAQITSNSFIGTFSGSSNSSSVLLNFTPTSGSTSVKFFRELV